MGFVKCTRCELNYILDGGNLCSVCRKEVRGEGEPEDLRELCSECGERPVAIGNELCVACLKEMTRHVVESTDDEEEPQEDPSLEIDSVSTMDEIAIDLDDDPLEDTEFDKDEVFEDEDEDQDDGLEMDLDDDDLLDR